MFSSDDSGRPEIAEVRGGPWRPGWQSVTVTLVILTLRIVPVFRWIAAAKPIRDQQVDGRGDMRQQRLEVRQPGSAKNRTGDGAHRRARSRR